MMVLISYDIENDKKRTKLANQLKNFGPRVQKSVFEADINENELVKMKNIFDKINLDTGDSIRLYRLCAECVKCIRIWGLGEVTKDKDFYII